MQPPPRTLELLSWASVHLLWLRVAVQLQAAHNPQYLALFLGCFTTDAALQAALRSRLQLS